MKIYIKGQKVHKHQVNILIMLYRILRPLDAETASPQLPYHRMKVSGEKGHTGDNLEGFASPQSFTIPDFPG